LPVIDFSDNFNRADGPLGVTSTGSKPWLSHAGDIAISSARALGGGLASVDAEVADYDVSLRYTDGAFLAFRVVDQQNYWRLRLHKAANSLYLERVVQSTFTTVQTFPLFTSTDINGRVVSRADGRIEVYRGTVQLGPAITDGALATATRVGMGSPLLGAYDDLLVTVLAKPPAAPTGLSPDGAAAQDVTQPITFSWTPHNEGLEQTAFRVSYRLGGGSWQVVDQPGTASSYTLPAGSLSPGSYEWEVVTSNAVGSSPPSARAFFTAAIPPGTPVITSPSTGELETAYPQEYPPTFSDATSAYAIISGSRHLTAWTANAQDAYQLRILTDVNLQPGTVLFDTGIVIESATRRRETQHPVNGRTEWLQVRVQRGGLWSGWASVRYTVTYTPPAPPTGLLDASGPWMHVLLVNPPPVGSQPTVLRNDLYRRLRGNSDPVGVRVAADLTQNAIWPDSHLAHLEDVEYRAVAFGVNGTEVSSSWFDDVVGVGLNVFDSEGFIDDEFELDTSGLSGGVYGPTYGTY
jgi:hypothetical protein